MKFNDAVAISAKGLEVERVIIFVVTVDVMDIELTFMFWDKATALAGGGEMFAVARLRGDGGPATF
jgi:hypothetical protein